MATGYLDNFYARLGIPQSATQEEIRTAYHQAARKFHPDQSKDKGSTEIFLHIQEAYETLSNPAKRAEYEFEIPVKDAEEMLLNLCEKPTIKKRRYSVPFKKFISIY